MHLTQSGLELEDNVAKTFEKNGFSVQRYVNVKSGSRTFNADIIAEKSGMRVVAECKNTPATINDIAILKAIPAEWKVVIAPNWADKHFSDSASKLNIELVNFSHLEEKIASIQLQYKHRFLGKFSKVSDTKQP